MIKEQVSHIDGVEILEGNACSDHIHICLEIPPKYAISNVVGRIKGRTSIMFFNRHPELSEITGRDRRLWATGYYVSTVGLDEEMIRNYIKNQ